MFQKKAKVIFADVSHYEVRMARVDRSPAKVVVGALESIPVTTPVETRQAIESFAGSSHGNFVQAHCAVYPKDRFLHRRFTENAMRSKQEDFAEKTLESELHLDPGKIKYRIIHPVSGRNYNPDESLSRETLFVGASRDCLKEEQSRLIELGIYPNHLEIASVALYGAIRRSILEEDLEGSVLVIELSENSSYGYVVNMAGLALSIPFEFGISAIATSLQSELNLQDALSAHKVMLSKTFDFRDMGSTLLQKLISEVHASAGQFEVQTGKSIGSLYLPGLPPSLSWIGEVLGEELRMEHWDPPMSEWLSKTGIALAPEAKGRDDLAEFLPLFSQMAHLEAPKP